MEANPDKQLLVLGKPYLEQETVQQTDITEKFTSNKNVDKRQS